MLTDEQRLAVIREIWALCYVLGLSSGFAALYAYERLVKAEAQA